MCCGVAYPRKCVTCNISKQQVEYPAAEIRSAFMHKRHRPRCRLCSYDNYSSRAYWNQLKFPPQSNSNSDDNSSRSLASTDRSLASTADREVRSLNSDDIDSIVSLSNRTRRRIARRSPNSNSSSSASSNASGSSTRSIEGDEFLRKPKRSMRRRGSSYLRSKMDKMRHYMNVTLSRRNSRRNSEVDFVRSW